MGEEWVITREEGEQMAKKFKLDYFEVSAKTGKNVEKIFDYMGDNLLDIVESKPP